MNALSGTEAMHTRLQYEQIWIAEHSQVPCRLKLREPQSFRPHLVGGDHVPDRTRGRYDLRIPCFLSDE